MSKSSKHFPFYFSKVSLLILSFTILLPFAKSFGDDRPSAGKPPEEVPPKAPVVVLQIPLAEGKVTLFKNRKPLVEAKPQALCLPYPMDLKKKVQGDFGYDSKAESRTVAFRLKEALLNRMVLIKAFKTVETSLKNCRLKKSEFDVCSSKAALLEFVRHELRDPISFYAAEFLTLWAPNALHGPSKLAVFEKKVLEQNLVETNDCTLGPSSSPSWITDTDTAE